MRQLWIVAYAFGVISFGCSSGSTGDGGGGNGGSGGTAPVVCDDIDQGLRVLWGDTHVHTRMSLDSF
jgi:hypothetical protein